MNSTEVTNPLDLTNCDKEKIHFISYSQGHGAFFAITPLDGKIRHIGANALAFFGREAAAEVFLGKKITEVISIDLFHAIQLRMRSPQFSLRGLQFTMKAARSLEVFIYKIDEQLVGIEIENFREDSDPMYNPEEKLNDFILEMQNATNLSELANVACRGVRTFTDFDRVMLYKFFPPDMYGEVIGEDKVANSQTFMSHRFPASDIPKPARDLYLRNHLRYIYDSHSENFEISPRLTAQGLPLDLSDSKLRGVSLIHLEYLKNMGVRGSLSIAVISEGRLWGLIACHSSSPKAVSQTARAFCKTIANSVALSLPILERYLHQNREVAFYRSFYETFSHLKVSRDPLNEIFKRGQEIRDLFNCSGFALISSQKIDVNGLSPLSRDLKELWSWLHRKMDAENLQIFVTESVSQYVPEFEIFKEQVSGLIAIRISEVEDSLFILMRPELIQNILWGGDPRKNIESRNYKGVINPRASFETWTETVRTSSIPWRSFEKTGAGNFRDLVFDSLIRKEQLLAELIAKTGKKSL
jgi:light-regulated signal transduction histidine kinase (bacteriophytochrome)